MGNIYTSESCPLCRGKLEHDKNLSAFICQNLECKKVSTVNKVRVKFGKKTRRRFQSYKEAEQFLSMLRYKYGENEYDPRDYEATNPLGFKTLADAYLQVKKEEEIGFKHYKDIKRTLDLAAKEWGDRNIKNLAEPEIEDFLNNAQSLKKEIKTVGAKTRNERKSHLQGFWKWVVRREKKRSGLQLPEFPTISFKSKLRTITDISVQEKIIDKIKELFYDINPRIWIAVLFLSFYPKIRPGELRKLEEHNIWLDQNVLFFPHPKEGEPKYVHIAPEHSHLLRDHWISSVGGSLYFFRNIKPRRGTTLGSPFGRDTLLRWWKKACKELEINGITLYPGTKHTTVTALSRVLTPEQIKRGGTGHRSKAFDRYLIPSEQESIMVTEAVLELRKKNRKKQERKVLNLKGEFAKS